LQQLADGYGISLRTRLWGSVRAQIRKGVDEASSGDIGQFALVLFEGAKPVATIDLATLFDLASS
jgi:hypothetical protein